MIDSAMNPAESNTTTTTATTTTEEARPADSSCYYPGCKKNANCDCEICLASINATLDLMPFSVHKSSLTNKLSAPPPPPTRSNLDYCSTPLSFDRSTISTPRSSSRPLLLVSPELKSTARASLNLNRKKKGKGGKGNRDCGSRGILLLKLLLPLILILATGAAAFSAWVWSTSTPVFFTADSVRAAGERSWVVKGHLSRRLMFVQNQLRAIVPQVKVSNCSYKDSAWQINQDGLILRSECVLYKSGAEEVKIWGWPFQTAGLIRTGFSSRSFTVLSGRVTEWVDGKIEYEVRRANSSWVQKEWEASAIQMDPNTWVLEYSRSWTIDNRGQLSSIVAELVKVRVLRLWERMKRVYHRSETYSGFRGDVQLKIRPT